MEEEEEEEGEVTEGEKKVREREISTDQMDKFWKSVSTCISDKLEWGK